MRNGGNDEGIELPERRATAVDVPLAQGNPVSPPFSTLDIRLYIYLAEELLTKRSRDETRESKEGEGCNERGREAEDTALGEHEERFGRQLTAFPEQRRPATRGRGSSAPAK